MECYMEINYLVLCLCIIKNNNKKIIKVVIVILKFYVWIFDWLYLVINEYYLFVYFKRSD